MKMLPIRKIMRLTPTTRMRKTKTVKMTHLKMTIQMTRQKNPKTSPQKMKTRSRLKINLILQK